MKQLRVVGGTDDRADYRADLIQSKFLKEVFYPAKLCCGRSRLGSTGLCTTFVKRRSATGRRWQPTERRIRSGRKVKNRR